MKEEEVSQQQQQEKKVGSSSGSGGMSLRQISRYGLNHENCENQMGLKAIYEIISNKNASGFLLPPLHKGCILHQWTQLDSGFCVCDICGKDHHCYRGDCPVFVSRYSEKICNITGCVVAEGEFMPERSANERTYTATTATTTSSSSTIMTTTNDAIASLTLSTTAATTTTTNPNHHHYYLSALLNKNNGNKNKGSGNSSNNNNSNKNNNNNNKSSSSSCNVKNINKVLFLFGGGSKLRDLVEATVREILASEKTEQCMIQEIRRCDTKLSTMFSKILREVSHSHKCIRPNMVTIISQLEYQCRKNRRASTRREIDIGSIIEQCTESITNLLIRFGGVRVTKQMQNATKCREFICSILYLMRMGITYQNRQLLPRLEILHELLPLQVLLPPIFHIRAKSITEGENIIKLDIRQMPLII